MHNYSPHFCFYLYILIFIGDHICCCCWQLAFTTHTNLLLSSDQVMILTRVRLRLVIFSGTRRTNRRRTYRNKIAGMKKNVCSLSNLTRNTFVLYFSTKKRNENEQQGKTIPCEWWFFFGNDKEFSVPFRSLVTIQSHISFYQSPN